MRLIDADALLKNGIKCPRGNNKESVVFIPAEDVCKAIEQAPIIEDAVVVVRCHKCCHSHRMISEFNRYCDRHKRVVLTADYCSYGKRKSDNE